MRLIDETGQQIGVVPIREALQLAMDRGLDLIEIAPQIKPPVCKILDYGKYLYEQKKEQQRAKKKQTVIKLHEIKFGISTNDYDLNHKKKKVEEFIAEGDKVKLTVVFYGREMEHKDLGKIILDKMLEKLKDITVVEMPAKLEGRTLFAIVAPIGKGHEIKNQ